MMCLPVRFQLTPLISNTVHPHHRTFSVQMKTCILYRRNILSLFLKYLSLVHFSWLCDNLSLAYGHLTNTIFEYFYCDEWSIAINKAIVSFLNPKTKTPLWAQFCVFYSEMTLVGTDARLSLSASPQICREAPLVWVRLKNYSKISVEAKNTSFTVMGIVECAAGRRGAVVGEVKG